MPELPEVEVTRLSFADKIAGAKVLSVQLGKPLRWPLGCSVADLVGRTVQRVRRRGKYLLIDLDQGLLLIHLGMSGSLSFLPHKPPMGPHDHFEMVTNRGILTLNDPRRFGSVVYADSEDSAIACKLLGGLGMEPLTDSFDLSKFQAGLKRRKAPIKQVLMAGDLVVGVGNIYASEVLFLAGIRPSLSAERISRARATRLHTVIREVLARAVSLGGSTLRNFTNADGVNGYFQLEAMVYGREGLPCRVCGSSIKSVKQGQRTTFYCPKCQKH